MPNIPLRLVLHGFAVVDCDTTVADAESSMRRSKQQAIPVLNADGTVFGLLTRANLAAFRSRPLNNPRATRVREICDASAPRWQEETGCGIVTRKTGNGLPNLVLDSDDRLLGLAMADGTTGASHAFSTLFPSDSARLH